VIVEGELQVHTTANETASLYIRYRGKYHISLHVDVIRDSVTPQEHFDTCPVRLNTGLARKVELEPLCNINRMFATGATVDDADSSKHY